jgi:protoheme IX farnesyltransferase
MLDVIKNYLLVTKPGIILGNLVSAAAGFFLASRGRIDMAVLLSTFIGITLVVASGCVFNNCIDRNMDREMIRTCDRVLAKGLMSVKVAVFYASSLGVAGTALLWVATNMLCVVIVLAGFTIYVGLYSLYLKRNSVFGTLIGSLAGAAPALAGYCAVGNRFDMGAVILLSIFSLWQMPHCYAIAIFRLRDYTAAAIPVLPVRQGIAAAKKHIVGYILAFVAATLMLTFGGYTGYRYLAVAAAMGLSWLYVAWTGYRTSDERIWAQRLFVFSLLTIFVLSVMMSIDFKVPSKHDTLVAYASSSNAPEAGEISARHQFVKAVCSLPRKAYSANDSDD